MTRRMGRRPGPATTRADILDAALDTVIADGMDKTTMRGIGRRAGVDAAIIYRHFSSKDELLDTLVSERFHDLGSIPDLRGASGADVVRFALHVWDSAASRIVGIAAIRAAMTDDAAAGVVRSVLSRTLLRAVESAVRPDHRDLRVSLVAAQVIGMALVRHRIKLPGLSKASQAEIVRVLGPVVEHYLHGDLGLPPAKGMSRVSGSRRWSTPVPGSAAGTGTPRPSAGSPPASP